MTEAQTLISVMTSVAPAPSLHRPALVGTAWDELCAKALQPKPARRFQTAREMSVAFTRLLEREGLPRLDELSEFVRRLEDASAPSTDRVDEPAKTRADIEEATMKKRP
jgi:hypothetical protein